MSNAWRQNDGEFQRETDGDAWCVSVRGGVVSLRRGLETLIWRDSAFERENGTKEVHPVRAVGAFIQEPAVIVPNEPIPTVGLELTARFLPDGDGFLAEFRALTVEPISNLRLGVAISLPQGVRVAAFPLAPDRGAAPGGVVPSNEAAWIQLSGAGKFSTIFLDLGEDGVVGFEEEQAGGGRIICSMFRQTLEKGVILVGRVGRQLGVVGAQRRPIGVDDYLRWREGDSFL